MLRKRAGLFATVMIKLEFHFAPMLTRIRQFLKSIHNSATPITLLHFFAIMLLISFWRVLWVWQLRDLIPENSTALIFQAFGVGLRLDLVVSALFTLPLFIIVFIPTSLSMNWGKYFIKTWSMISGLAIGISMIIDIEFFREFDSHINLTVTQYLGTDELWQFLWATYPMVRYLLLMIGVTGLWWFGFNRIFRKIHLQPSNPRWLPIPAFLILAILLVIAGRGGLQERPVNWGNAIFSQNHFANQTALNPLYFFGRSMAQLSDTKNLKATLSYFPADTAWTITQELISSPDDIFPNPQNPLRRRHQPPEHPLTKPHIVLVILETFPGEYCGYLNPVYTDITPNLDAISRDGITLQRIYANGHRTAQGLGAILCSWPNLPGTPVIYRVEAQRNMPTAASVLGDVGYETTFLYGGDADFDNMGGFFLANGYDRIYEQDDFPADTPATMWGVYDEYLFDKTLTILDTAETPHFLTVLTVSNHQPWSLPAHREAQIPPYRNQSHPNADMLRTMRYVDTIIGEFLDSARQRTWFDSTLFVFVSDHGRTLHQAEFHDPRNPRIVGLFYGPAFIDEPLQIGTITSQIDILPTLLGIIHLDGEDTFWGRNRLMPGPGFAGMLRNERFDWYAGDYFYEEVLGDQSRLYRYSDSWDTGIEDVTQSESVRYNSLQREARAFLQSAYFGFGQRFFDPTNLQVKAD